MADDVTKQKAVISHTRTDGEDNLNRVDPLVGKKSTKKYFWFFGVVAILLLAIGSSIYFYTKYQDVKSNPADAISQNNTEETQRILNDLKAILLVTETDAPTVARVEDSEKLKSSNPDFYRDIQKSDYLIIFPKRAIIYRDSNNQIINIAPIINANELQKPAETPAETSEDN